MPNNKHMDIHTTPVLCNVENVLPQWIFNSGKPTHSIIKSYLSFRAEHHSCLRKKFKFNYPNKVKISFLMNPSIDENAVDRTYNSPTRYKLLYQIENDSVNMSITLERIPYSVMQRMAERKWSYLYLKIRVAKRRACQGKLPATTYQVVTQSNNDEIFEFLCQDIFDQLIYTPIETIIKKPICFDESCLRSLKSSTLVEYLGDGATLLRKVQEKLLNEKFPLVSAIAEELGVHDVDILQLAYEKADFDIVTVLPYGYYSRLFDCNTESFDSYNLDPDVLCIAPALCKVMCDKESISLLQSTKGYKCIYRNPALPPRSIPTIMDVIPCAIKYARQKKTFWRIVDISKKLARSITVKQSCLRIPLSQLEVIKSHLNNFSRQKPWLKKDTDVVLFEWKFAAEYITKKTLARKAVVTRLELERIIHQFLKEHNITLDKTKKEPSDSSISKYLSDESPAWRNRN